MNAALNALARLKEKEREKFAGWTEGDRETYEERAAIMEFDGGLSRRTAEKRAYEMVRSEIRAREAQARANKHETR